MLNSTDLLQFADVPSSCAVVRVHLGLQLMALCVQSQSIHQSVSKLQRLTLHIQGAL